MALKLTPNEVDWINDEFNSGRTYQEIAIDTGMSVQNIKRALAEAGSLSLSWYKTSQEHTILEYLRTNDVQTLEQLVIKLGKNLQP